MFQELNATERGARDERRLNAETIHEATVDRRQTIHILIDGCRITSTHKQHAKKKIQSKTSLHRQARKDNRHECAHARARKLQIRELGTLTLRGSIFSTTASSLRCFGRGIYVQQKQQKNTHSVTPQPLYHSNSRFSHPSIWPAPPPHLPLLQFTHSTNTQAHTHARTHLHENAVDRDFRVQAINHFHEFLLSDLSGQCHLLGCDAA
jgi:hypothetical protein